ncbi:hypothetical protein [Pseudomonas sp. S2_H10]
MLPQTFAEKASLVPPSRKRSFIMVLLLITVAINYMVPSNLLSAAPIVMGSLVSDDPIVPVITDIAVLALIGALSDVSLFCKFKWIEM